MTFCTIGHWATHTFVSRVLSMMLEIKVTSHPSQIEIVNDKAKSMFGVIRNASVEMESFEGRINMMVIEIDKFDIILGRNVPKT